MVLCKMTTERCDWDDGNGTCNQLAQYVLQHRHVKDTRRFICHMHGNEFRGIIWSDNYITIDLRLL